MLFLLFSIVVGGLLIGLLGRLVVPGPNPIGLLWTLLCGLGGAVIGGLVAGLLFHRPGAHWFLTLVLEVLAAALLVWLLSKRRRRHPV
ncbi:MAG: GlsB/YeaQ/YmgE family stress response membrane protein [Actinomycetota bacterium]|nr:GlsB/YeaQ/YmgE family stress response membrane protein [Actinomycetota bacterium]